jgi:hypothetical protein
MIVEIIIPLIVFSTMFGALYMYLTTRNRERMAMIEKGIDPGIFKPKFNRLGIKLGLLAIGIAIGVMLGQLIHHTTGMYTEAATFSMIFLFAGIGLVFDHFLAKKESK